MGGLHLLALVCLVFIQNCCASEKRTDVLTDVEEKVLGKLVDRVKDNPKYRDELRRLLGDDVSKRQECEDLSDFAPGIEPAVNIGREERIARAGRLHENDEPSQHLKFNVQTGAAEEVLAEGDMKLTPEQYDELYGNNTLTKRKGMRATRYRWTNKVIPYEISGFSGDDLSEINAAIADWNGFTCLNFRPRRSSDGPYVYINKQASGCWSYVGMVFSGQQKLNLGRGCTTKDIAIHELGHTIGLQHEQSRHDRDQHVTVYFDRIEGGKGEDDVNFKKYNADQMIYGGLPYDYTSIMHYSEAAFSSNGQPTLVAIDSTYQKLMGNGKGLSFPDVKLVNIMYECGSHCSGTCPNDGYHDENCVCQCKSDTTPFDHCGHVPIKPCDGSAYRGPAPEACPECTDIHNVPTCNQYKNIGGCGVDSRYRQDAWTNCYKTCSGCATGGSGGGPPGPAPAPTPAPATGTCGGSLSGSGTFTSPNFPGQYPNNAACTWTISAPSGQTIKLTQTANSAFGIEAASSNSCYDTLFVQDSAGTSRTVCGKSGFEDFNARTNQVTVRFTSDGSTTDVGFSLAYEAVGGGGGGGDCSDKKSQSACDYWKGLGYCTKSSYISYLTENCKATCNLC